MLRPGRGEVRCYEGYGCVMLQEGQIHQPYPTRGVALRGALVGGASRVTARLGAWKAGHRGGAAAVGSSWQPPVAGGSDMRPLDTPRVL